MALRPSVENMAAAESCAEDDAAASGGAEKEKSKGKGKESILAVTAVHGSKVNTLAWS